ncbi:protease inhibitor I42 family protein [Nocardia sp. NBC_01009]|uniref:protease inhibitor I42 family protein n=1 Tax=Nocardia sp. NBC_01009 TaxID=2975996 RepID=UPI003869E8C5|nr:protease inhibitor I42 family protein [Nocardia sp. NBC_01009]
MRKFLLVLVLGATLVACGTNDSDPETKGTSSTRPTEHTAHDALAMTDSNNGQERTLRIGQQLVVSLPANPSTGYTWGLGELEQQVLRQDGEPDYRPDPNVPVAPGSGGTAVWTFVGNSAGVAQLTLDYTRPWEQGIDPAQKFSLTIKVE